MSKEEKSEAPAKEVMPHFEQHTVAWSHRTQSCNVQLFEVAGDISGAAMLAGFPNLGLTPVLTCNYLVEDLNLPLIGGVQCTKLPPTAVISGRGQPNHAIRVFGDKRLVVVASEMKVPDGEASRDLIACIVALARHINTSMLYCCEGLATEGIEAIEREQINYLTSSPELGAKLLELGHKTLHDAVITGITGGLISACTIRNDVNDSPLHVCCLLAPTSSYYPDAWSSVVVIHVLDKLSGDSWTSDTSRLESSAAKLEEKVKGLMRSSLKRSGNSYSQMYT